MHRIPVRLVVASGLALAGLTGTLSFATAASAASRTASCSIVTAATIKSDLGLKVSAPKSLGSASSDLHCDYAIGSNPLGVQISFVAESLSTFQSLAKAYTGSGDPTISGVGQDGFASSVHSTGTSASDISFYAGGYDVTVGAVASLSSVEKVGKLLAADA